MCWALSDAPSCRDFNVQGQRRRVPLRLATYVTSRWFLEQWRYVLESTCVSGLPVHHGLVLRPIHVLENVGGKSERHK